MTDGIEHSWLSPWSALEIHDSLARHLRETQNVIFVWIARSVRKYSESPRKDGAKRFRYSVVISRDGAKRFHQSSIHRSSEPVFDKPIYHDSMQEVFIRGFTDVRSSFILIHDQSFEELLRGACVQQHAGKHKNRMTDRVQQHRSSAA